MSILWRNESVLVKVTMNGEARIGRAQPRMLLSDFIRTELAATGTHVGCEHGVCGACTVRIDGIAQRACLTLAVQLDGRELQTVEGLANHAVLNDLQSAFKRHFALQCGFCTAGILMSCADWLERLPADEPVDDSQVRGMLSGHLCRCTGYTPIVAAVIEVANDRQCARRNGVTAATSEVGHA